MSPRIFFLYASDLMPLDHASVRSCERHPKVVAFLRFTRPEQLHRRRQGFCRCWVLVSPSTRPSSGAPQHRLELGELGLLLAALLLIADRTGGGGIPHPLLTALYPWRAALLSFCSGLPSAWP